MSNGRVRCDKCGTENDVIPPSIPPQIVNGMNVSCGVFINMRFKCWGCGTDYVSQIGGFQMQIVWTEVPQQSRIVVPNVIPPRP